MLRRIAARPPHCTRPLRRPRGCAGAVGDHSPQAAAAAARGFDAAPQERGHVLASARSVEIIALAAGAPHARASLSCMLLTGVAGCRAACCTWWKTCWRSCLRARCTLWCVTFSLWTMRHEPWRRCSSRMLWAPSWCRWLPGAPPRPRVPLPLCLCQQRQRRQLRWQPRQLLAERAGGVLCVSKLAVWRAGRSLCVHAFELLDHATQPIDRGHKFDRLPRAPCCVGC